MLSSFNFFMKNPVFRVARRARGDASAQKHSRNINNAVLQAKIGLFSQAALESGVKRGLMNQSSCPRLLPVLIERRRSMLVPSTEHIGFTSTNPMHVKFEALTNFQSCSRQ